MRLPWSYGWNVVACAVFYQAVCLGTLIYGTAFLIKPWAETFAASRGDVVLVPVFWMVSMALAAPFVGRGLDTAPIRRLVLVGLGLFVTGLLLTTQARTLWHVIAIYSTLMAMASLLAGALSAQALAAKWFVEQRGLAIGIVALGTSVGGLAIPPILALLVTRYGWRGGFVWLAAATVLIMMPIVWVVLAREPELAAATGDRHGATASARNRTWTTRDVLKCRGFWVPVIGLTLLVLTAQGVQMNLAAHAQDHGHGAAKAASLLSLLSLAMVFGKLLIGGLADRVDHRRLYWGACTGMLVGLPALINSGSFFMLMVGAACVGFACGGVLPLAGAVLAAEFGAASFGRVMGLAYVVLNVSACGPLLAGVIYDRTGAYTGAFAVFVVINVLGMLLMTRHRVAGNTAVPLSAGAAQA